MTSAQEATLAPSGRPNSLYVHIANLVQRHQQVVVHECGRLGRGLRRTHPGAAEDRGHLAGRAAGGVPVGDGGHVTRSGGAVQLGNVEDRFVGGDFGVLEHSPRRTGQQFGDPGVDDGLRNIGGSDRLPGEVEGQHAVIG